MKTPLRHRIAAVALLLSAPLATACTRGFGEQTDQQYQPAVGVNDHSGTVDILDAAVVANDSNAGTLSVTLLNHGTDPDQLVSVTGLGVQATGTPIALPSEQPAKLWQTAKVVVSGPGVVAGDWVRLTLNFASGQSTELNMPVVTPTGDFADVKVPTAAGAAG